MATTNVNLDDVLGALSGQAPQGNVITLTFGQAANGVGAPEYEGPALAL